MRTSTSAVVTGTEAVETRDLSIPDPADDAAVLEVELGGVCGTDPKIYDGHLYGDQLPAVLGHEILGRIDAIGDQARDRFGVEVGDRVVVEAPLRCGECRHCLRGAYQFCADSVKYGFRPVADAPGAWGSHGEYIALEPGTLAHPIDDGVPAEAAVLACAVVGNSVRWLQSGADDAIGKSVVIQGPGPQGLSMTAVAARAGYDPIVVAGVPGDEDRLDLAADLGADHTVCAPPEAIVDEVSARLAHGAADIVVNLTGHPDSVQQSVDLVDINGTIVYPAITGGQEISVDLDDLVWKGARLQGVLSRTAEHVDQAISLIEDDPAPFASLVSARFAVEEAETAYRRVGGMEGEPPLKAVIDPSL